MASSLGQSAWIELAGLAALLVDSLTSLSFFPCGPACPFRLSYFFLGFALCGHELCGGCAISIGVGYIVLLYFCAGLLACLSGLPRGFYSVAGLVYCSLPEFVYYLPLFL